MCVYVCVQGLKIGESCRKEEDLEMVVQGQVREKGRTGVAGVGFDNWRLSLWCKPSHKG